MTDAVARRAAAALAVVVVLLASGVVWGLREIADLRSDISKGQAVAATSSPRDEELVEALGVALREIRSDIDNLQRRSQETCERLSEALFGDDYRVDRQCWGYG